MPPRRAYALRRPRRKPKAIQPYARRPSVKVLRRKKGRTGTKRRAAVRGVMQRHAAPVAAGYSVSRGQRGPGGVGYSMTQVSDTCTRITGRAYVGEVSTVGKIAIPVAPNTTSVGNALGLIFDVNPILLNDRVAVIASTFEKYVYHGVKFTYVPQCPTSTPGSVGLVFDRDPLMYSANPRQPQFLSEIMSYEHPVLTPAYVEASTAYGRDPKEMKTWFLGGTDATLTTRETSQGNLLVYLSNAASQTAYGFIVMDYVLDLVAPNLLPNKQNATNIKSGPSQWLDFSGKNAGSTLFTGDASMTVPIGPGAASTALPLFIPDAAFVAKVGPANFRAGVVGEIQLGGVTAPAGLDTVNYVFPNFFDAQANGVNPIQGQKLYFCTHVSNSNTGVETLNVSFHLTLSSARASAGTISTAFVGFQPGMFGDFLYTGVGGTVNVGGWMRLITDGAGYVDSA